MLCVCVCVCCVGGGPGGGSGGGVYIKCNETLLVCITCALAHVLTIKPKMCYVIFDEDCMIFK